MDLENAQSRLINDNKSDNERWNQKYEMLTQEYIN
jgi:hypothetical protein